MLAIMGILGVIFVGILADGLFSGDEAAAETDDRAQDNPDPAEVTDDLVHPWEDDGPDPLEGDGDDDEDEDQGAFALVDPAFGVTDDHQGIGDGIETSDRDDNAEGPAADLRGGSGDDLLDGTPAADRILGAGGADQINAGSGDDTLYGGTGSDVIWGGDGADHLFGGQGDDRLQGDAGDDWLRGGAGRDELSGHAGADSLYGGRGDDSLLGGEGNDSLDGGAGRDWLAGGEGNDLLIGGAGRDTLDGGAGDDRLYGTGPDHDDRQVDFLNGGQGQDELWLGSGDYGSGGEGGDVFNLTQWLGEGGFAIITDYDPVEDQIVVVFDPAVHADPQLSLQPAEDGGATSILLDGHVIAMVNGKVSLSELELLAA